MSLFNKQFFKNFLSLVVLALVMFMVTGCKKDDKIELSFSQNSYEVTVGQEIEVKPNVTKGKDVKEVKLIYSSEDVDVATYIDGKVKGISVGEIKVKVAVDGRPTVYKEVTIKVNAQQVVTYEITYHLNQGTNSSQNPTSYTEADLPITLANPTRDGYIFKGWFDNANFNGDPITGIAAGATGNKALYAKWEEEPVVEPTYTITYNLDGGTNHNDNPASFEAKDLPITLKDATKSGFVFVGWFENADFSGTKVTTIAADVKKDVVLYAKFDKIHTITYELDGGSLPAEAVKTFTKNDLDVTLPTPTKDGHKFEGWYLASDFSGNAVTKLTAEGDVKVYAKWSVVPKTYTITYVLDGGTLPTGAATEYTEGQTFVLPIPEKDGFDFAGWYLASDFSGEAITELTNQGSVSVYAKWTEETSVTTYEIIYHLDGGQLPAGAQNYYTAGKVFVLPIPTKEGESFIGWFTDEDYENGPVTEISAEETGLKVFYAKFQERIVSQITYHVNGGKYITNHEELKHDFMVDYYNFMMPDMSFNDFVHGAGKTSGYQGPWAIKNSDNSVTINNLYTANNKDADPNSTNFINIPAYNAKWLQLFDLLEELVKETNPSQSLWGSTWTGNIRFREFFVGERYKDDPRFLELDIIPNSLITEYDNVDGLELLKPIKTGFIFGGWYETEDFSGQPLFKLEKGMIGDKVLYARWLTVMHKVTFDVDGETTEVEVENGKLVTKPANPVKEGFDFVGWFLGDNEFNFETEITGPITLTAKFKEIDYVHAETIEEFKAALVNEKIKFIYLKNDLVSDEKKLLLNRDGVTIDGKGFTISFAGTEGWASEYILHVYNAKDIVIKDIKLTGGDAGLLVNGSVVRLEGEVNVSGNEFGGIEVSLGEGLENQPQLILANDLVLINDTEAYALPTIWEDKVTDSVVGADDLTATDSIKEGQVQYFLDIKNASQVIWTVTFDVDGTTTKVEVIDGAKVVMPDNPTKEGHQFAGWFIGDTEFDPETVITEDITVVAKFLEVEPVLNDAKQAFLTNYEMVKYFPYGMFPDNQIKNLPTSVEGFPTVTIKWAPGDTNEFTADLKLIKQRMLYYETPIIATLSSPGETDITIEFKVNIGLVETKEAYGISSVSRAGATSFDVAAYNAENGFGNTFDGGTNITGRSFLFGGLIFKSNFKWGSVTADFYYFARKGNIFTINDNHLVDEGDKFRITGKSAGSWHESSFARIIHNTTDKDGTITGTQLKDVLGLQGHNAYHIFIIDAEGNITKYTGTNPDQSYVIPAGGYIIERGYIDGNASNSGNLTAAVLGFFNNATKVEIIKVDVHASYK